MDCKEHFWQGTSFFSFALHKGNALRIITLQRKIVILRSEATKNLAFQPKVSFALKLEILLSFRSLRMTFLSILQL